MRHRKSKATLDRKAGPRKALLRSLAISLVTHGRIQTTPAKAKAVRPMVERAIAVGKRGDLAARRRIIQTLGSVTAAEKILTSWAPKLSEHTGGVTRIVRIAPRQGDGSPQVLLEFVHGV